LDITFLYHIDMFYDIYLNCKTNFYSI